MRQGGGIVNQNTDAYVTDQPRGRRHGVSARFRMGKEDMIQYMDIVRAGGEVLVKTPAGKGVLVAVLFGFDKNGNARQKTYECTGTRHACNLLRKLFDSNNPAEAAFTIEGWSDDKDNVIRWDRSKFHTSGHHLMDRNNTHYNDGE